MIEDNGEAVASAVLPRLEDKSLPEGDKWKHVYALASAKQPPAAAALRNLRRAALFRQSDECFYDHRRMTRIILMVSAYAQ